MAPTAPLAGLRLEAEAAVEVEVEVEADVDVDVDVDLVTVKLVEALASPLSSAVMICDPFGALGTVNWADQVPLAATVGLAGVRVRGDPAKLADTVFPETYPVPVRVTPLVPTVPLEGDRRTAVLTMKFVPEVAELVPSDTTTLWAPLGTDGTVKVTVVLPFGPVVPPEVMAATVPPTDTVNDFEATKPWAEI